MKRYLIKEIATATDNNENFKGEVKTYYHGKGNFSGEGENHLVWLAKNHGYSTKAAAASALKRTRENREWFEQKYHTWMHELDLVEVEISE